jgi:hypothetical protein
MKPGLYRISKDKVLLLPDVTLFNFHCACSYSNARFDPGIRCWICSPLPLALTQTHLEAEDRKFWGTIELSFGAGQIGLGRTAAIKPPFLAETLLA